MTAVTPDEQLRVVALAAIHTTRLALGLTASAVACVAALCTAVAWMAGWQVMPALYGVVTAVALGGCSLALRWHGPALADVIAREVPR